MIQVTAHIHDIFNDDVFKFCSKLLNTDKTTEQKKNLLYDYYSVLNIRLDYLHELYEVQEVNNCMLIYQGQKHLLTIKFEL